MLPYTTGTVSLTNGLATVTGVGTLWLTNIQSGDLFTIEGEHLYIVIAVTSDTSLTLNRVYAESTVSGQAYTIARVSSGWGLPADLAQACIELTDKYRTRWVTGQGPKGDKGDVALKIQGNYAPTKTYNPGDIVANGTTIYLCIILCTGKDPAADNSSYWKELTVSTYTITEGDPI